MKIYLSIFTILIICACSSGQNTSENPLINTCWALTESSIIGIDKSMMDVPDSTERDINECFHYEFKTNKKLKISGYTKSYRFVNNGFDIENEHYEIIELTDNKMLTYSGYNLDSIPLYISTFERIDCDSVNNIVGSNSSVFWDWFKHMVLK